jgi:hypothetical protein
LGLSVPLLDELAMRTGNKQQQLLGEQPQAAQVTQQQQAAFMQSAMDQCTAAG